MFRGGPQDPGNGAGPLVQQGHTPGEDGATPGSGGILPGAKKEGRTVTVQIKRSAILKCRIQYINSWSALREITFVKQEENYNNLIVTELHYHPPDWIRGSDTVPGTDLEFIEFYNAGNQPLNLSGLRLDSAVRYSFPENMLLYPKQFYVVASNPPMFYDFYGLPASGNYSGQLSNGGEEVVLADPAGNPIIRFTYLDNLPWPPEADGTGFSLKIVKRVKCPDDRGIFSASIQRPKDE